MYDDATAQLQDFLLLQRVAHRISSILDLDVLLEQIVEDVASTFGYSRSGILLLDEARGDLVIVAVRGWTTNYHIKGDRFGLDYGMIGYVASTGRMHYAPDVRLEPHYQVSEPSTLSEVDVPIRARDRLIGVFNAQHAEVDAFPPHRLQLLEALAGHIGIAVDNARMFERERRERERMGRDLADARAIQTRLFPETAPSVPGFRLTGLSKPCLEVGGDWFDYIALPDGRVGIVLGDVAGKGPGAALLMTSTRSVLRMHAERGGSPATVLAGVNEVLRTDLPASRFVTLIYAVLDPVARTITYANAGHPPPALAASDRIEVLRHRSELPLGIRNGAYTDRRLTLAPGDRIVLYSDGLTEARNPAGEEFGTERLVRSTSAPESTASSLLEAVEAHAGDRPFADDVTIVVVEAEP
ncbi:MAG TPA: GAF domain-containing SpoIIE family protein phosphatase [Rhodothermales bacterium]